MGGGEHLEGPRLPLGVVGKYWHQSRCHPTSSQLVSADRQRRLAKGVSLEEQPHLRASEREVVQGRHATQVLRGLQGKD